VRTIDTIDLVGIDAGRLFHAQLETAVEVNGRTALPAGADVFLKATRRQVPNVNPNVVQIAITVDHFNADSQSIPVTTNDLYRSLRVNALPPSRPEASPPRLSGAMGQGNELMPQTRIYFMVTQTR
jgi:hypothetical protein